MNPRNLLPLLFPLTLSAAFSNQTVLVVDGAANEVKSFTSAATGSWTYNGVLIPSGTYDGKPLTSLFGMAVHGHRLFVAEGANGGRILEFTTTGDFVKTVYTFPSSTSPRMLTYGPDGFLYMSDAFGTSGDCIWRVDVDRRSASIFITQAAGAFVNPHGIAFASDGFLYIADRDTAGAGTSNGRIKRFSTGGTLLNTNVATTLQPMGLEWDAANSRLLVGAGFGGVVRSITTSGANTQIIDDSANFPYFGFAVIDGQLYGTRSGNSTSTSGVCRITGTLPSPLVTGTNFAGTTAQMAALPVDSDADQLPDSWEITHFILPGEDPVTDAAAILARQDGADDSDGDGLDNLGEFLRSTSPVDPDSDHDGLPDGVETNTGIWTSAADTGTHPLRPDSDGDGLLDGHEDNTGVFSSPTSTGTDPHLADTDADGANDYLEISRGSDPVSNLSTPSASSPTPLVSLDAENLVAGSLSSWTNEGSLGRSFEAGFSPHVETIGGVKGVTFSGAEVLTGPAVPSNLAGASPRTIEAWIFNPSSSAEETIVAWGRRDGPNGSNLSFNHGSSPSFGSAGHWGTPDMSWGSDASAIAANLKIGTWTHVVYTYDGGSSNVGTVYVNGTLANTKVLGALSTWTVDNTAAARPLPIRIAGQNAADGLIASVGEKGAFTLARLRIHDRVLSASELGFTDTDGDGMKDWFEDFYGLDKQTNDAGDDPDDDGLTNLQEQAAGTNPSIADTDDDGMPDGWEFTHFGHIAAHPNDDADGDGATNLQEYLAAQGLTIERDGSGFVTGLIPFAGSSDPNDPDSQPDSDGDGLPDGWERSFLGGLSFSKDDDTDGDGFNNEVEFYAGSNPGDIASTPSDTDADGLADTWEIDHFGNLTGQSGEGDPDGDLCSNLEEFTGSSDPNDPDSQPDSDGDTLPDGWERRYLGNLSQNATDDFDGDGFSNGAEQAAGSNPARPRNTPGNVNDTVRVAIGTSLGIDEYSVVNDQWTFVRRIFTGETISLFFHNGGFYAASTDTIRRIDPATGDAVVLATRNQGDAVAAGWIASTARGMELGPDGRIYVITAFGTPNGEGIFRLNLDGTGFERFIARSGAGYELFNAIDLAWKDADTLYVTARGAFDATNRPVYRFDGSGAFVEPLATSLQGPQGLLVDGSTLWVTGTNAASALVALDTTATPPVTASKIHTGSATNPEVVEILGELHVVAFSGAIYKDTFRPALTQVSSVSGANANDMAVFSTGAASDYATWAAGYGLDPQTPQGAETGDADLDGTPNNAEFALGLDPIDPNSRFAISTTGSAAAGLTLAWPSAAGIPFQVRSSTDLVDWTTLEATVTGAVGQNTATWTTPPVSGGRKFFRIEFTP